ncbi:DUF6225 family protein [Uniformispora flossi]|uniref:DUF6225 family protein n=1 Tax=Uniformispora flossi TaxID=3390723 RepID=UPI003C2C26DE
MTSDPKTDAETAPETTDDTPATSPPGQPPAAVLIRHEASAMTVGDLRAALAELEDGTPIKVAVPDGRVPGEGVGVDDGYTIVGVGFGRSEWGDGRVETESALTIECDFVSADYDANGRDSR